MISAKQRTTFRFVIGLAALSLVLVTVQTTRAQLNSSRARGALRRMAGFELTNGAVRVKTITDASQTTANVTAELRTVFRLEQDDAGHWRIAEVRVAPDRWEDVALISNALSAQFPVDECSSPGLQLGRKAPIEPTPK